MAEPVVRLIIHLHGMARQRGTFVLDDVIIFSIEIFVVLFLLLLTYP